MCLNPTDRAGVLAFAKGLPVGVISHIQLHTTCEEKMVFENVVDVVQFLSTIESEKGALVFKDLVASGLLRPL